MAGTARFGSHLKFNRCCDWASRRAALAPTICMQKRLTNWSDLSTIWMVYSAWMLRDRMRSVHNRLAHSKSLLVTLTQRQKKSCNVCYSTFSLENFFLGVYRRTTNTVSFPSRCQNLLKMCTLIFPWDKWNLAHTYVRFLRSLHDTISFSNFLSGAPNHLFSCNLHCVVALSFNTPINARASPASSHRNNNFQGYITSLTVTNWASFILFPLHFLYFWCFSLLCAHSLSSGNQPPLTFRHVSHSKPYTLVRFFRPDFAIRISIALQRVYAISNQMSWRLQMWQQCLSSVHSQYRVVTNAH